MQINVSKEAAAWYKEELNLQDGSFVRFFVRYGGHSAIQKGFSLGISTDIPEDLGAETEQNGITFYIEEKDLWFFDGHDLAVNFNAQREEPEFDYSK
ncbi:HesB/YadR/YfhF family protein [Mesobacillus harenae]|uniref:HesB/YadR/YfhF family protein n=1 Tax=Mesobacillus harenae TaxID=2213203 RepID=UPI00158091D1|nr:HesB/YadR/YfhF family protein [Mesobacillus harenae]